MRYIKRVLWLAAALLFVHWVSHVRFDWIGFLKYLQTNQESISLYGLVFVTAVVVTMPEIPPKTFQDWWTWCRNALSKHFNLVPHPATSATQTVTVTETATKEPVKDAVASPKA